MERVYRVLKSAVAGIAVVMMLTGIAFSAENNKVTPPKGWVLDTAVARKQKMVALLYPKGGSADKSANIMYIIKKKKPADFKNIDDYIKADLERRKQKAPKLHVKDGPKVKTSGKEARVKFEFVDLGGEELHRQTGSRMDKSQSFRVQAHSRSRGPTV